MNHEPLVNNIFCGEYNRANTGTQRIRFNFDGVFEFADEKTLWIIDACYEQEALGHMFIMGKEIKLHVIRDGRLVRFNFNEDFGFFIYPYDPSIYQLSYTDLAA